MAFKKRDLPVRILNSATLSFFLLFQFAILTFCIHQIFAQQNVRPGARRLSSDVSFNSNPSQRRVTIADTPDEFEIKKPSNTKDKNYDDFLSFLYRNDKAKLNSKSKREIRSDTSDNAELGRGKRMLVFRWVSVIFPEWPSQQHAAAFFLDLCLSTSSKKSNVRRWLSRNKRRKPKSHQSPRNAFRADALCRRRVKGLKLSVNFYERPARTEDFST